MALLCRFAAIFDDDDAEAATATVEAAYRSLHPADWTGYWPTAADWLTRVDLRGQNVTWYTNDAGHWWGRPSPHSALIQTGKSASHDATAPPVRRRPST